MENTPFDGLEIGRIVMYVAYGTPKGEFPALAERAAIVTEVNDKEQGIVSLCVVNPSGLFFNSSIRYQEDGQAGGTWHWPVRK